MLGDLDSGVRAQAPKPEDVTQNRKIMRPCLEVPGIPVGSGGLSKN